MAEGEEGRASGGAAADAATSTSSPAAAVPEGDARGAAAAALAAKVDEVLRNVKFNLELRTEVLAGPAWGTAQALERQQRQELERMLAQHRLLARARAAREHAGLTASAVLKRQLERG